MTITAPTIERMGVIFMHDDVQLFPLTNAQQRIWYTELLYPNTSVSLLLGTVKFKGNMNLDALMRSINMVIEQYDAFRIRIASENGIPLQYIVPFEYKGVHLSGCSRFCWSRRTECLAGASYPDTI